jgi:hypothetical protein
MKRNLCSPQSLQGPPSSLHSAHNQTRKKNSAPVVVTHGQKGYCIESDLSSCHKWQLKQSSQEPMQSQMRNQNLGVTQDARNTSICEEGS